MALGIGGISTSSLFAQNALRVNSLLLSRTTSQLSSGNRLINAGIDPSGLAMSMMFRSQIGGTEQAIYNTQDAVNLTRTAESTLNTQGEILGRMRDISIRSANDATLTAQDRTRLNNEFQSLNAELDRTGEASQFNTKQLTSAVNPYGTKQVQATPDNNTAANPTVTINSSTSATLGTAGQDISSVAGAQNAITAIDTAMQNVANQQVNLGTTENLLQYRTNDLEAMRINMSASNSTLADLDFAQAITEHTKGTMLSKFAVAAIAQSNAQGLGVLKLLGAG
ncbi:MAG TPA: flagellin [bacterium]|nr:flagellin [bacterium]